MTLIKGTEVIFLSCDLAGFCIFFFWLIYAGFIDYLIDVSIFATLGVIIYGGFAYISYVF